MAYQNFYATRLATDIGATDTTITVEIAPTATSGRLVLEARNPTQREIIKYSGVSGNQLTGVQRAQGGTVAAPHLKNALVEMNVTAGDLKDLYDAWDSFVASAGNGWVNMAVAPTLLATNGNRSFDISIAGDKTAILSKGMRLLIPRTGTTPTMSADFNGTTQYAKVTGATGHNFTDDFTVEAKIFLDNYPASGTSAIVGRLQAATANGWVLSVNANGQLRLYTKEVSQASDTVLSNIPVPLGRWADVAISMDISGNVSRVYLDGVEQGSTYFNSGTTVVTQAGDLAIGAEATGGNFFDGRISDVRVWSTLRSPQQIRDNANQQLTGSETGLVGYWKLNGDFNDSTTNANHLVAQAGATATFAAHPFNANAYAIISSTPVFTGGNTTMTVQTPVGYPIPNQTLGTASYSIQKTPFGFPSEADKWNITVDNISLSKAAAVADTFYDTSGGFLLPKGHWRLKFRGSTDVQTATASSFAYVVLALSTSLTTGTNYALSCATGTGTMTTTEIQGFAQGEDMVEITTPTQYYFIALSHRAGALAVNNAYTVAEFTLL